MKPEDFGLENYLKKIKDRNIFDGYEPCRVLAEYRERYLVLTGKGEMEAEVTGNLRYTSGSREDFPAVGDWVAAMFYDSGPAIIHKLFPRYSVLKRQASGHAGEVQVIAANIDCAFLMQAIDRDFNMNRLERYLAICYSSNVEPIIVLSKTDLIPRLRTQEIIDSIKLRIKNVPVLTLSNETGEGFEVLKQYLVKGKTCCMLGSSGVGKSSLLNNLAGKEVMQTGNISWSTGKGKHVTSHREMVLLDNGGLLIDNPGMREVGVAGSSPALESTFEMIAHYAENCRYKNCTHTSEAGCAVIEGVEKGIIDEDAFMNFKKLQKEQAYFDATFEDRRRRDRILGKVIKDYNKMYSKRKK